jgi:hypothetical protein
MANTTWIYSSTDTCRRLLLSAHPAILPDPSTQAPAESLTHSSLTLSNTYSIVSSMYPGISQVGVASASQPRDRMLPVLPALRDLFPHGGLQRGSVVAVPGSGLLSLAIAAGASAAGAWCAVVGRPEFGVQAALGVGVDPGRLLLVDAPGERWPQVTAAMLDGCEVVIVSPPAHIPAHVKRHVEATLRRAGGVLVVAGDWAGAQARLWVARQQWAGMGQGHGRLTGRRVQVLAAGRGAAMRPAERWLWLPGPDGGVTAADPGTGGWLAARAG